MNRAELSILYSDLELGETRRERCPFCGDKEKTFTITRDDDGIVYNCYRASCSVSGNISPTGTRSKTVQVSQGNSGSPSRNIKGGTKDKSERKASSNNNTKQTLQRIPGTERVARGPITEEIIELLWTRYGLSKEIAIQNNWAVLRCDIPTLSIPIYNKIGDHVGYVDKVLSKVSSRPKAINSGHFDRTTIHYPTSNISNYFDSIFLVEDAISSVKASIHLGEKTTSAALLGSSVTEKMIPELREYKKVYLALDKDATKKAYKIRNKLKGILNLYVVPLSKDIKDSNIETILDIKRRLCGTTNIKYNTE